MPKKILDRAVALSCTVYGDHGDAAVGPLMPSRSTTRADLMKVSYGTNDVLWRGPTPAFPPMADRLDKAKFSAKKHVPRSR
jgi:hypothetical protein